MVFWPFLYIFIFYFIFFLKLEILGIRTASGQAKVLGTLVGLGGATFLTLYKGPDINPWSTKKDLLKFHPKGDHHQAMPHEPAKRIMGAVFAIASTFSYSLWLIIQVIFRQNDHLVLGTILTWSIILTCNTCWWN